MKNKEPKFVFVILHYLTLDDTIECVESIITNIKYTNYHIVIVDNGSPNNSGTKLKEIYKQKENIEVILSKANLGFAKGNNIGYSYAKLTLYADFIVLINNDTIIYQPDFISKIIEKYQEEKFHILGPDILSAVNNEHQNPRPLSIQNKTVLKKTIRLYKILLFLNYFLLDKIFEKIKKTIVNKPVINNVNNSIDWEKELKDVKLHGSALIFSTLYIESYDYALYPETFMYSEEAILYFIAKRDKLKTIYYPEIQILHKEDSSTEMAFNKNYKKRRFYYKNFIKSGKVFLKLMENTK